MIGGDYMKKKYLKLTDDQKARGVIFSSQLQPGNKIHEVFSTDDDQKIVKKRLLNDSFFDNSHCGYTFNEIRE
jgi:hypothetical protein